MVAFFYPGCMLESFSIFRLEFYFLQYTDTISLAYTFISNSLKFFPNIPLYILPTLRNTEIRECQNLKNWNSKWKIQLLFLF